MNMVTIAESTPGPIAINAATYIGYKIGKFLGSLVATIGVCIPSFVIIFVISLFFNQFLAIEWVAKAFKGIQIGVIFLIASAGIKMFIKLPKTLFNVILLSATFICMITLSVLAVDFSSIFYILISAVAGLTVYTVKYLIDKKKEGKK